MRIDEFASAEEQMALWKLVNDKVWQAIETQRQQQAQAAQAKAAKAKLKPRKGRKGGRGKLSIPTPPPPPSPKVPQAKKPEASANPQLAKPQNLTQPLQQNIGGDKLSQVNSANPHIPTSQPTQQMSGGTPQQQPQVANPTQLQQPPHEPLKQQQMRLQRRNSSLLSRNTSV